MWDLVGNPEDRFSHNEAHIVDVLNFSDTHLLYCKHFKIYSKRFCHGVIPPKDANRISYSGNPDQTAPLGAF